MNPVHSGSHSRWARASYFFSVLALAAGIGVVALRMGAGPWASLLGALIVIPLGFWVIVRTSLYGRVYRGKLLALVGFLIAFLGLSDAVGELCHRGLWRHAYRLNGGAVSFENPSEGWRVRFPKLWKTYSMRNEGVSTFFFKPEKTSPAIEFSLTHRSGAKPNLENAVENFLLALPKSGETQILFRGEIRYPLFQHAYQVIYEDPGQAVVLRHRLIFLSNEEGLTVLSVAALPLWYDRLSADSEQFLFSFEPLG